jgi:phage-related protein
MIVKHLDDAEEEARDLGAEVQFQHAIELLTDNSWQHLTSKRLVRPLKGKAFKGVYEVATGAYRAAFVIWTGNTAIILAFCKKEGQELKKSDKKRIQARALKARSL